MRTRGALIMNTAERIITLIRRNRISTTEVADCMNKTGVIPDVSPITPNLFRVGLVHFSYGYNESNWATHDLLRTFSEGKILVAIPVDCGERALFGALVSKFIMLYRQGEAIVVQGPLRDMPHLKKEGWPIWCTGATPIGCFNTEKDAYLPSEQEAQLRSQYEGSIAVCDDSGVVLIPKSLHTEEFIEKLKFIEEQEDTWFDCIDRLKWDTYDTVCLKKYREKK